MLDLQNTSMTREQLLDELATLRARLAEPEETVHAIRHGEVDAFVVLGAAGESVYMLGTAELLRQLQVITDSLPVLVAYVDSDLRYRFNNQGYEAWLGRPLHEITGRMIAEVLGEAIFASLRQEVGEALAGRRAVFERWLDLPGAGRCCAEHTLVPHVHDGKVQGFVAFIQDVTERRRAEDSVRLLADSGRVLSDSAGGEAALLAEAARLAVPALADRCSFELDAGGGRRGLAFPAGAAGQPEEAPPCSRLDVPLVAHGRTLGIWGLCYTDSGRRYGQKEREVAQELAGRVAVALDNSRLYRELEAASRAKDQFLAALSHELRTPLAPVLAMASRLLAQGASLPASVREGLAVIRRNVELEARLIDDLLDLTRIGRGTLELRPQLTDLHQVVRQAVETCDGGALAERRLVEDLAAPAPYVSGDPARLVQVFWNLLSNALKFTPPGGLIHLRSHEAAAPEPEPGAAAAGAARQLVVEVSDSGIGVDPQSLPHIFDAFDQGEEGTARRFGGLGLGLAISRAIVELHGGSVAVHSAGRDQGATFTVRLPLSAAAAGGEGEDAAAEIATPGGLVAPAVPRALRVLVVEDHADTAAAVAGLLEAAGHRVTVAGTVAAALAAAESGPPDLVISDLGLPDGDGYDLMRALAGRHPGLRGIALSGYGMTADVEKSLAAGFALHLVKPVTLEALAAAVLRTAAPAPDTP